MENKHQLTKIQKVALSCVTRWGEDKKTKNFSGKLGRFLCQLDTDKELGNMLLELVNKYNYYSKQKIVNIMSDFYQKIVYELRLEKSHTIYSRIEDDSKIDSSNSFLEEFKYVNDITNYYSHSIEKLSIDDIKKIKNIVFLDDIIGTGETVKSFFEKNIDKLKEVKCYIFCIELLEESKLLLESFFKKKNIECVIIYHNLHKKAFSERYIFHENWDENEKKLQKFERELWGKQSEFILGYRNCQAMISFFRNTPNNTISSFWFENKNWKGLFPREKEKPQFMISKKSNFRYNIKKLENLKNDKL
ncbi:MAG: hypothetical protein N4A47_02515 [Clostridia bacterium]|jgi:hypothetical protein|nr:hypothetical protein [Clostridia bacterium]